MRTPLATRIAETYASWSLFVSAYAPLALIFAMRLVAKSRPVKAEACVAVFAVLTLNLIVMLWLFRAAPHDFTAAEVDSGTGELAAYAATYLLPFVVVGDVTNWDLAAYAAFLFILGVICVRGDLLHLNPLLALRGYRLYTITTGRGRRWLALSLERIQKGDVLEARVVFHRLLLVLLNRSALERSTNE